MSIQLTPAAEGCLQAIDRAEENLRNLDTWLVDMSKIDRGMQAVLARCTVPRDRYEKHVGRANALFTPMEWDDIMEFAYTHQQDCIDHKWNYFCMLEHLSAKFPKKMSDFQFSISNLRERVTRFKNVLKEIPITESDAEECKTIMKVDVSNLANIIMGMQKAMRKQWDKAVELLQQLHKADMCHPNCCADARKASALANFDILCEADRAVQCGPKCGIEGSCVASCSGLRPAHGIRG